MAMTVVRDALALIGNTPLVRLKGPSEATGCEILAKCEFMNPGGSVKDRAALAIIEDAEAPHRLVERGHGGYLNRIPNVTEWLLSEAGRGGCEVQVTFWTEPARAFDKLRDAKASERRLGKGLKKALERLRGVAESGTPPERIAVAGGDRLGA